jgi:hypothetical protein
LKTILRFGTWKTGTQLYIIYHFSLNGTFNCPRKLGTVGAGLLNYQFLMIYNEGCHLRDSDCASKKNIEKKEESLLT